MHCILSLIFLRLHCKGIQLICSLSLAKRLTHSLNDTFLKGENYKIAF